MIHWSPAWPETWRDDTWLSETFGTLGPKSASASNRRSPSRSVPRVRRLWKLTTTNPRRRLLRRRLLHTCSSTSHWWSRTLKLDVCRLRLNLVLCLAKSVFGYCPARPCPLRLGVLTYHFWVFAAAQKLPTAVALDWVTRRDEQERGIWVKHFRNSSSMGPRVHHQQ